MNLFIYYTSCTLGELADLMPRALSWKYEVGAFRLYDMYADDKH